MSRSFPWMVLCVSALALAVGACGDDAEASPPDADAPDAPLPDGAPWDAAPPDAYPLDAAPTDASAADAAPPALQVLVRDHATPVPDVVVVHSGIDGTLVSTATTGADGRASFEVTAGDAITVAWATATYREAFTFVAVEPQDALEVDIGVPASTTPAPVGVIEVLPPAVLPAGTASLLADAGCAQRDTIAVPVVEPLKIMTTTACHTPGAAIPVLVLARDATGKTLAYQLVSTTSPATLTLGDSWQAPEPGHIALYAATPQQIEGSTFDALVRHPTGEGFRPPGESLVEDAHDVTIGVATFPAQLATPGVRWFTALALYPAQERTQRDVHVGHGAPLEAATGGGDFPPFMEGLHHDPGDATTRPAIGWTLGSPSGWLTGQIVTAMWTGPVFWTFVVPPDVTAVTIPALPAVLDAWSPTPETLPYLHGQAVYASFLADAAAFRAFVVRPLTVTIDGVSRFDLPLVGRLMSSEL